MARNCKKVENNITDEKQVMDLAMKAGQILLENGAEISRVGETMEHICRSFGVDSAHNFVLSNGIILTGDSYAKVRHIPVGGICMEKIVAVNELSREIEQGQWSLAEAGSRLRTIDTMSDGRIPEKILASAVGSGAFCYFFGGNIMDSLVACAAGLVYGLAAFWLLSPKLSKITRNLLGGFLLTAVCASGYLLGIGKHLNYMIIGSVMPPIPGVPFINSVRELAAGDYISGAVRMLDALLAFFCIAAGVGFGILLFHQLSGGVML